MPAGIPASVRHFYPRPPRGGRLRDPLIKNLYLGISIHALREEGDPPPARPACGSPDFYPRPPRGGRRLVRGRQRHGKLISIHALREEGDCPFSSRRVALPEISIHALREEGDCRKWCTTSSRRNFYPRPPRGGRQQKQRENPLLLSHYTPPCTNCKEMLAKQTAKSHRYLRKRLVFRCEASRKTMCAAGSHWPGIKRSARCLGQTPGAVQRARPSSDSCCPAGRTADCPRQGRSGRSALL